MAKCLYTLKKHARPMSQQTISRKRALRKADTLPDSEEIWQLTWAELFPHLERARAVFEAIEQACPDGAEPGLARGSGAGPRRRLPQ